MATRRTHWLKTLLALGLCSPVATGFEPPAVARQSDRELAQRVQTVLHADAVLTSRALLVSVVDGVAVIGGPLRSNLETERLQRVLAIVPGLMDARISTWIPVKPTREPAAVTRLTSERSAKIDPRANGQVMAQRAAPVPDVFLLEPAPIAASKLPTRGGSAYSPVPPPAPPAPSGPAEYPTIPAQSVPVSPVQNVASAIEELRRTDARFANFPVEVKSGTITIESSREESESAWDFCELVRKVPGVTRVIVASRGAR